MISANNFEHICWFQKAWDARQVRIFGCDLAVTNCVLRTFTQTLEVVKCYDSDLPTLLSLPSLKAIVVEDSLDQLIVSRRLMGIKNWVRSNLETPRKLKPPASQNFEIPKVSRKMMAERWLGIGHTKVADTSDGYGSRYFVLTKYVKPGCRIHIAWSDNNKTETEVRGRVAARSTPQSGNALV